MKTFVAFLCCFLSLSCLGFAALAQNQRGVLESVRYLGGNGNVESIEIRLGSGVTPGVTPKTFVLGGERPRLVLDFQDIVPSDAVKNVTEVGGSYIRRVRVGVHYNPIMKTRVVLDLTTSQKLDNTRTLEDGNLLRVDLFPKGAEPDSGIAAARPAVTEESSAGAPLVTETKTPRAAVDIPKEETGGIVEIEKVSFEQSTEDKEMVFFYLKGFKAPTVYAVDQSNLHVACEFPDAVMGEDVPAVFETAGRYVKSVSFTAQENPATVRAMLTLDSASNYNLKQVFFKDDNLFVLMVNSSGPRVTTK